MNILSVQNLAKAHGVKQLFTDVSFGLEERDRAALIGPNGCGKSTLLRIVAGLESADAGTVVLSQGLTARYLSQHPQSEPGQTALDFVFAGGGEAASLVRQYEALQQRMALGEAGAAEADRLEKLSRRMDAADAWQYETRARAILTKLGIDRTDVPMDTLSGGFRRRVALARVLVEQPDLLILDEPTNHLDVELIEWLEDLLRRYPGTVLLVTHDRYFLDRVSRRILEIDRGRIFQFEGNWQNYLRRKAEMADADAAESRRLKSMLREDTAWAQRGARARRTKERKRYDKMDARQNRLDELQGRGPGGAPTFEVETRRLGKKIVELDGVSKRLGDNPILENFHYLFAPGERLGIVGPNGSGKSTLANLIAGRLQPDSGTIDVGETVKFGYFTQEAAELPLHERVIDYVKREGGEMLPRPGGGHVTAEVMLGDFFFPPQAQFAPIGKLSGGERRRLHLVLTLMRDPNFLIFDEPTNDLDLMTLQALEEFLDGFSGCLIVISHDRWFLDRNVEHLLIFDLPQPGCPPRIRRFEGNYTEWREAREADAGRGGPAGDTKAAGTAAPGPNGRPAANAGAPSGKTSAGKTTGGNAPGSPGAAPTTTGAKGRTERAPRLSYMEKRELEELERRTIEMEERMRTLDAEMTEQATNYERLRDLAREREQLETELGRATARWEELAERA